jgi:hypothetical protein
MSPDEIATMACDRTPIHWGSLGWFTVLRAISIAIQDERERCAKIADGFTCGACGMDGKAGAAIRSRSGS